MWILEQTLQRKVGKKMKVRMIRLSRLSTRSGFRSNRLFDKKQLIAYMKKYIKNLTPKKHIEGATKFIVSKLKDLQFFVGESMHDDGTMVFAYYKEGATDPTFMYLAHGLKEVKC